MSQVPWKACRWKYRKTLSWTISVDNQYSVNLSSLISNCSAIPWLFSALPCFLQAQNFTEGLQWLNITWNAPPNTCWTIFSNQIISSYYLHSSDLPSSMNSSLNDKVYTLNRQIGSWCKLIGIICIDPKAQEVYPNS